MLYFTSAILGEQGSKLERIVWDKLCELVQQPHLVLFASKVRDLNNVFINSRGYPLTRFGVGYIIRSRIDSAVHHCPSLAKKKIGPHTFRHTTAMHLLQSGVDLTVIKNWLGHVNLDTTHTYVEIDLEMKRRALSSCAPACTPRNLQHLIKHNNDLIGWLESL